MPLPSSAFQSRAFVAYLLANFASQMGTWIQRIAIGWLSWELSHSATLVGFISLLLFTPTLLFGALFGVLADRVALKSASIAANIALAFMAGLFSATEIGGWLSFPALALLAFAQGLAAAAYQPIRLSVIAEIVPASQLASAIALNSVAFNLSRLLGPAVSGLCIASGGVSLAFAVNAVSVLPLLAVVSLLKFSNRVARTRAEDASLLTDFEEALRFLGSSPRLGQQLAITALTSILGRGPMELMPALAARTFSNGATGLAWCGAAVGAGAMVAGLVFAFAPVPSSDLPRWALACALAIGVATCSLAFAGAPMLVLSTVFCLGAATTFSAVASQTVLQREVDPELRGRVTSIWLMISLGGPALAGLGLGMLADTFGFPSMLASSGAACILGAIALNRPSRNA
jgi:MFS family permease